MTAPSRRIFVALLDEDVEVWRPVEAVPLGGARYRIAEQPYDREIETWQFEPGDVVEVDTVASSDGPIPAAVRRAQEP